MSEQELKPCHECGWLSPLKLLGEEVLTSMNDRSIAGVGRDFAIGCPVHSLSKQH